jgi:very-short-patch-repair endonuclease
MCLAHIPSQSGQGAEKMILEEETFREFGYISSELKPQSNKKILAACDGCGKVRIASKNTYHALCISCALKGKHPSEETRRKLSEANKGKNHPFFGKHHTEEAKRKISEGHKGQIPWNKERTGVFSEETRRKIGDAQKGKHHSEERKKKISDAHKGLHPSKEARQNMSEAQKDREITEETRRKLSESLKGNKNSFGKHPSEKARQKMSEAAKKHWQDPVYIKKVFDGLNMKPNAQEKKVGAILQKHVPDEYAYNGDFSCGITIGGKIPDFVNVNGEKIVIEVFGPWHDEKHMREHFGDDIPWKRTEFGTKAHYSQFGYKCVVFWQEDLEREDAEQYVLSVLRENKII